MNNIKKNAIRQLKGLRESKNLTQKEIASKLNIDRSTYAYWESAKTEPSIKHLIKLSKIYNVTIDYLIGN